jgi:hypothetical protein
LVSNARAKKKHEADPSAVKGGVTSPTVEGAVIVFAPFFHAVVHVAQHIFRDLRLFVCLFVCMFVCFGGVSNAGDLPKGGVFPAWIARWQFLDEAARRAVRPGQ